MTSLFPLLIVLLFCQQSVPVRLKYSYAIVARAVDARGRPVPNATMEVRRVEGDRGSDATTTSYADSTGCFRVIVFDSDLFSSERIVIVRAPVPPNSLVLEPPCYEQANNEGGPCQAGRRVTIKRKGVVDLGDIDVQHVVCATALSVTGNFDQALLSTPAGWTHLHVRLRDERGNVGAKHPLTKDEVERCVDVCGPQLRLALPPGAWTIEASKDDDTSRWLPMGKQLLVHADCNPLTIVVRNAPLPSTRPN